jgi:WD40 repeat protein
MSITKSLVVALAALLAAPSAHAQLDAYGDALPDGAIARLGTMRFRHSFSATHLAFTPNGKILASVGQGSGVRLWDAHTGRLLHHLVGERFADALALSPDGTKVFAALRLYEVATGKELLRFKSKDDDIQEGQLAAWSRDGRIIATGPHANNKIVLWDAATGMEIRRTEGQGRNTRITALAFSPTDDAVLAAADFDKNVRIWDAATGKSLHNIKAHEKEVHCIAFTRDGGTLISGGGDGRMRFWDVKSGRQLHEIKPGRPTVNSVAFTSDGKLLAATGIGGAISLWDAHTRKEIRRWETHEATASTLAFSPDGKTLAASAGPAIRLWDPANGQEVNPFSAHRGFVYVIRFADDAKSLFSYGDGQAIQWDLASRRNTGRLARGPLGPSGTERWYAMDLAPDGQTLAVASLDLLATDRTKRFIPGIHLWNTTTGVKVDTLLGHTGRVREFRFSPNSKVLASTDLDGGIKLWDVAARKEIHHLAAEVLQTSPTFTADGKLIVASGSDGLMRQWDVASGKELRKWSIADDELYLLALSPDGRLFAGSSGRGVGVWSAETGKQLAQFNQSSRISALAFSPNGRVLATAGFGSEGNYYDENKTRIQMWELRSTQEIRVINAPNTYLFQLVFSPDGRTLATAGSDSAVMLWDATGQARQADKLRKPLTAKQLDALWDDLRAEAAKAEPAIWTLALAPEQATPFLKERLRPTPPADAKQTAKLLADLGGNNFNLREQAERTLIALGAAAEPALRRFVQSNPPLEVLRRVERILEKRGPDELRHLRTIDALEQIGAPAARSVLQWLSSETVNPRVKTEAELALARIEKK